MVKILIADDHSIVRRGLKLILRETFGTGATGEAANGLEALNRAGDYDLVLLDIAMPGMNGLEVLKELRRRKSRVPVLILTMYPEEQYAIRALRAGASGYLTKESAPDELVTAIRKVLAGGRYVSSSLAERLAAYVDHDIEKPLHDTLSDREYEVMRLIASGRRVKEIAEELSLSAKTVSSYRGRVLTKLNMKNNAELTLYAIQNQLL